MNIETERLENQIARLKVVIDLDRWQEAKEKTARVLSNKYRIPGFRKGKAPYRIVARHLGEGLIVEETVDTFGQEIYPKALDEAGIDPYAPGTIENFELQPAPTFTFKVPMQPEVDLHDYRSVRLDYEAPVISDEDVDEVLEDLRKREALVEESAHPVRMGDRVTLDVHSVFADDPPAEEAEADPAEAEAAEDAADEDVPTEPPPQKGAEYFHRHGLELDLDPDNPPLMPGFAEALEGATVDESREFDLVVPDEEDYQDARGRTIHFEVTITKVENVTLPALNDDLAARVTKEEETPLTLLELRQRIRENMQREAERSSEQEYGNEVLGKMVEQAEIRYPDIMVEERIDGLIDELKNTLAEQGIDLDMYQKVLNLSDEELREQQRPRAIDGVKRSLVLGEVMVAEKLRVSDEDVDQELNVILSQFGDQAEQFRSIFDTDEQRYNIANNLLYDRVMKRIALIGRGEAPDLTAQDTEAADDDAPADDAAAAEPANDEPAATADDSAATAEDTQTDEEQS